MEIKYFHKYTELHQSASLPSCCTNNSAVAITNVIKASSSLLRHQTSDIKQNKFQHISLL